MKKLAISALGFVFVCLLTLPPALGQQPQDDELNVNGSTSSGSNIFTAPGVNAAGYNQTTGLGTLTVTVSGSSCSTCNVDLWLFTPVATPFQNEYGATTGSVSSGQSWQIDVPDNDPSGNRTGNIISNTDLNTLDNTNHVTGNTSNYLNDCGANTSGGTVDSTCNDLVSMAIGFTFGSPGSGNQEVLTFTASLTGCVSGSICLEDIHPPDGNNPNGGGILFFSATETSGPICTGPSCGPPPPTVPEPSTWLTLGTSLVGLFGFRKRFR